MATRRVPRAGRACHYVAKGRNLFWQRKSTGSQLLFRSFWRHLNDSGREISTVSEHQSEGTFCFVSEVLPGIHFWVPLHTSYWWAHEKFPSANILEGGRGRFSNVIHFWIHLHTSYLWATRIFHLSCQYSWRRERAVFKLCANNNYESIIQLYAQLTSGVTATCGALLSAKNNVTSFSY